MSARAAATRYARALFDVARQEGTPEQANAELSRVARLLETYPELQRVLTNPAVPAAGKRGVVTDLAGRLELSPAVTRLLQMLADRDRLSLLSDLAAVFEERVLDHQQVVRAEVVTAAPLSAEQTSMLERRLSDVTGRRVTMTASVDPSLIGGVVAKIGSVEYDASVARQLLAMRQRLIQEI